MLSNERGVIDWLVDWLIVWMMKRNVVSCEENWCLIYYVMGEILFYTKEKVSAQQFTSRTRSRLRGAIMGVTSNSLPSWSWQMSCGNLFIIMNRAADYYHCLWIQNGLSSFLKFETGIFTLIMSITEEGRYKVLLELFNQIQKQQPQTITNSSPFS